MRVFYHRDRRLRAEFRILPLPYAYVRHRGASQHDAEDLIQGFFEHFYEREIITRVEPVTGKLRAFLLAK